MMNRMTGHCGAVSPDRPALRGYGTVYRKGEVNFCPGCGKSHWYIGRLMAECAYCGTAVPLQDCDLQGATSGHSRHHYMPKVDAA